MPNIKSAIKRVSVSEHKRLINKKNKSALRTIVKRADAAIAEGAENVIDHVKAAQKAIDKACAKGILHKNTAARQKSRLAKLLSK